MISVSYTGRQLTINSNKITLDEDIDQIVTTDEIVLVRCSKGDLGPRNLFGFDKSGNILWQIAPLKKFEEDTTRPVKAIDERDEYIQIRDLDGDRYRLEPKTGETEFLGGSH